MTRLPLYASIATLSLGALLLLLTGILGWAVIPKIIDNRVEEETRLEPGNDVWDKWLNLPVPIYQSFYFFSLLNVDEYEDAMGRGNLSSFVPRFEEVGPFVFREIRNKTYVEFWEHDTILYKQRTRYIFDEDLSGPGLTERTTVNILNVPLITVLTLQDIHKKTYPFSPAVLGSLNTANQGLFLMDVPVGEVLFTGYNLNKDFPIYSNVEGIARLLGIPLPDEIKDGVFAFFRGKNESDDEGLWQVYRGVEHPSLFSVIRMMNSEYTGPKYDLTDWWSDGCAMINGTDGTMFPPFITKSRVLQIFVPEICRSIHLTYDSEVTYKDIPGYRFRLPTEIFDKPDSEGHPNSCFCPPVMEPLEGGCEYKGVWKLFRCKANVPMVVSKPHYLDGDEELVDGGRRGGMSPSREEHDSYVDVEPNTGFPLNVHVRLQIGAEVQRYHTLSHIAPFNSFQRAYLPVFWVDKGAALDEPLVEEINDKLLKPLKQVNIGRWSLIGVGALLVVVGGGLVWKFK